MTIPEPVAETVAPARAGQVEGGRIRYHGTATELRDNPELLRSAYLLREEIGGRPRP